MIELPWYGWLLLGVIIGWVIEWLLDNTRIQSRKVNAIKMQLLQREMTDWRVRAVDLDEQLRLTRQELNRVEEEMIETRHEHGAMAEQLEEVLGQLQQRERVLSVALDRLKSLGALPQKKDPPEQL